MRHELKILPEYFKDVIEARKTFEVRKDNRDFSVNDTILLQEYDRGLFTGRDCLVNIKFILSSHQFKGIADGYCVLGIQLLEPLTISENHKSIVDDGENDKFEVLTNISKYSQFDMYEAYKHGQEYIPLGTNKDLPSDCEIKNLPFWEWLNMYESGTNK